MALPEHLNGGDTFVKFRTSRHISSLLCCALAQPVYAKAPARRVALVWTSPQCQPVPALQDGSSTTRSFAFLALLPLVIEPLAKAGITAIGDALQKAGAPGDTLITGDYDTYLYAFAPPARPAAAAPPLPPPLPAALPAAAPAPGDAKSDDADPDQMLGLGFRAECIAVAFGPLKTGDTAIDRYASAGLAVALKQLRRTTNPPLDAKGELDRFVTANLDMAIDSRRRIVIVFALEVSTEYTAFRLVPRYVALDQSMEDAVDKKRSEAITLSFLPPGAAADGTATAARTVIIPDVDQATERAVSKDSQPTPRFPLRSEIAGRYATTWIPLPALPDGQQARVTAAVARLRNAQDIDKRVEQSATRLGLLGRPPKSLSSDEQRQLAELNRHAEAKLTPAQLKAAKQDQLRLAPIVVSDRELLKSLAPYTIRADLHETTPGSKTLVAIGKLLSNNAEKVAAAAGKVADFKQRAADDEADTQKVEAQRIASLTAQAAFAKAQAASDANAQSIARIQWDAACRQVEAAGYSEPSCWARPQ